MNYDNPYHIAAIVALTFCVVLAIISAYIEWRPEDEVVSETVEKAENLPSDAMNVSDPLEYLELPEPSEDGEKEPPETNSVPKPVKPKPVLPEVEVAYFDVPLSEDLQDHIFKLCDEHNIDPAIVIALIQKESNFDADAISYNGSSFGLMQINEKWHKARMKRVGCTDLFNPHQNVAVGIDLLAELYDMNSSTAWVLMAYNGGCSYANENFAEGIISSYAQSVIHNSKSLERG